MKTTKITCLILLLGILLPLAAQKQAKYVDCGDASIYYEVLGEGKPVVILHGGLGNMNGYASLADSLKSAYKVIAVSLRGHNRSTLGNRPYSFDLFAQDIIAILDNEKENKASIIGFSDGGVTAYCLAALYPQRIDRIISLAGCFRYSDYKPEGVNWIKTVTGKQRLGKDASLSDIARMDSLITCMRPLWQTKIYISQEKAAEIKAPTLIIGGDKDFFFSTECFENAYRTIPNSKLIILPNTGHNLNQPEIIHKFIIPFLKEKSRLLN